MLRTFNLSLMVIFALVMTASVSTGGKPPKPVTLPPVKYQLHYFNSPVGAQINEIHDMNEWGVIVGDAFQVGGNYLGWIYNPSVDPDSAYNLNDLVEIPTGYVIAAALGVNDHGAIVASIELTAQREPLAPDFERHGILIDTQQPKVNGRWPSIVLPDMAERISFARDINNDGVVLGVFNSAGDPYSTVGVFLYDPDLYGPEGPDFDAPPELVPVEAWSRSHVALNDPAPGYPLQVAGRMASGSLFRYTAGEVEVDSYAVDISASYPRINGYGVICGRARVKKSKGTQYVHMPFRFDPDAEPSPTLLGSESEHQMSIARDINNSGDVVIDSKWLYHEGKGMLDLDLLVQGTTEELSLWRDNPYWGATGVTERKSATGFPVICGHGSVSGTWLGVLLIPVAP